VQRLGRLVIASVIPALAIGGAVSPTEALDRWVGTATISAGGIATPLDFTVLVDPGRGASWAWRSGSTEVASGPLAAYVSGSTVNGTLFTTGGLAARDPLCCAPCNFSGTIAGNRVDGVFDPGSCKGEGAFFLVKQGTTAGTQAPVIGNLVALSGPGPCHVPQGFRVVIQGYGFDYIDANGDVSGGHVEVGGPAFGTYPVPSANVSITGTTSGKITVRECFIATGSVAASTFRRVTLVDAAGNRSNQLSGTVAAQSPRN
jgi:hypothetical protein